MTAMTFSEILAEEYATERKSHPSMYAEHGYDLDPVLYQNRQWSVTEFGIENHRGPVHYYIPWSDIAPTPEGEWGWEAHMAVKNWVDTDAFNDVFRTANRMKIDGYTPPKREPAA